MLCYSITSSKSLFTSILILLINISALAQKTDVVILNNGDKITGEVKYLRVGILTYKTDNMETVEIQWNKIKSIETKNFFEVEVSDGRVFYGSISPSHDEGMMTVNGVTIDHNLFMKYIARINRIKESFWDILDGHIKLGFSFTKASQVGQLSLGGSAKYRTKIYFSELSLNSVTKMIYPFLTSSILQMNGSLPVLHHFRKTANLELSCAHH
ncbi:MAG: hypothetical protein MUE64_09585 [Ignavibacteriaceae bacterium]|nr:hypothetical protein [Ignavibacteriaceae bacterium]